MTQNLTSKYNETIMTSQEKLLENRIVELSRLNYNWNGDGAVVPSDVILKNSSKFIDCVISKGYMSYINPDDIVPTPYGTIVMDFIKNDNMVSVEIGKNEIGFFTEFADTENMDSEKIETDFQSIPLIIEQALTHLY